MRNQVIRGVSIPKIGLGTWELSGDECVETILAAAEIGYRNFDTAVRYANEESVGKGLAQSGLPRNELFVTTKVWITDLAKESINDVVGQSLDRLRLDYVDLLLIHWPSPHFTVQYSVESLSIAKASGQARNIGVSNFPPKLLREALSYADVFCNQIEFHPYLSQDQIISMAVQHELLITAYAPLAIGRVSTEPLLIAIGAKHGKTPAQVVLRWICDHPNVIAIPKSRSKNRLIENFNIWDFTLSQEETQAITNLACGLRIYDEEWVADWEDGSQGPRTALRTTTLN
jgi:2,5-diketo-D-gluconate reductase B